MIENEGNFKRIVIIDVWLIRVCILIIETVTSSGVGIITEY